MPRAACDMHHHSRYGTSVPATEEKARRANLVVPGGVVAVSVGCGEKALTRAALAVAALATPGRHLFGSLAAEAQLNHILTAELYDLTT